MKKLVLLCFIPLFLIGCSNEQTIQVSGVATDEEKRTEIEDLIRNMEDVYTGTAIMVEDEVLVAIQVKPWLGFKEQKVEKKLQKEIEEKYPDLNVVVSSDFKMHWETQKLLEEEDEKKVTDEVKKLKDLAKEET
ncbi:YhcN/YlaJ family sporulation lipoprotein [Lysinibacillus sp. SGAir0095]|uniref:YhcN/YlaJ family sporulation lipoprotein n=1 Tax=Lysinibacillus sp. SGAir0095 TaxID=2070463 RepID=UPI00143D7367|nr:YhcN/YlaJ family sporulation lipoprotein [Lysinibacillus sp. SGAir0095]